MHQKTAGFTLIELMVTLVVATILIVVAVPSLNQFFEAQRALSAISVIQHTLQYARNAAISFGMSITVCPIKTDSCSKDWHLGLTVFTDSGDKNQIDGTDTILLQTSPFNPKDIVSYNRSSVRFHSDGLASGSNGTLRYCPSSATSPYSKAVIVNQAGRVRFSQATNIECSN